MSRYRKLVTGVVAVSLIAGVVTTPAMAAEDPSSPSQAVVENSESSDPVPSEEASQDAAVSDSGEDPDPSSSSGEVTPVPTESGIPQSEEPQPEPSQSSAPPISADVPASPEWQGSPQQRAVAEVNRQYGPGAIVLPGASISPNGLIRVPVRVTAWRNAKRPNRKQRNLQAMPDRLEAKLLVFKSPMIDYFTDAEPLDRADVRMLKSRKFKIKKDGVQEVAFSVGKKLGKKLYKAGPGVLDNQINIQFVTRKDTDPGTYEYDLLRVTSIRGGQLEPLKASQAGPSRSRFLSDKRQLALSGATTRAWNTQYAKKGKTTYYRYQQPNLQKLLYRFTVRFESCPPIYQEIAKKTAAGIPLSDDDKLDKRVCNNILSMYVTKIKGADKNWKEWAAANPTQLPDWGKILGLTAKGSQDIAAAGMVIRNNSPYATEVVYKPLSCVKGSAFPSEPWSPAQILPMGGKLVIDDFTPVTEGNTFKAAGTRRVMNLMMATGESAYGGYKYYEKWSTYKQGRNHYKSAPDYDAGAFAVPRENEPMSYQDPYLSWGTYFGVLGVNFGVQFFKAWRSDSCGRDDISPMFNTKFTALGISDPANGVPYSPQSWNSNGTVNGQRVGVNNRPVPAGWGAPDAGHMEAQIGMVSMATWIWHGGSPINGPNPNSQRDDQTGSITNTGEFVQTVNPQEAAISLSWLGTDVGRFGPYPAGSRIPNHHTSTPLYKGAVKAEAVRRDDSLGGGATIYCDIGNWNFTSPWTSDDSPATTTTLNDVVVNREAAASQNGSPLVDAISGVSYRVMFRAFGENGTAIYARGYEPGTTTPGLGPNAAAQAISGQLSTRVSGYLTTNQAKDLVMPDGQGGWMPYNGPFPKKFGCSVTAIAAVPQGLGSQGSLSDIQNYSQNNFQWASVPYTAAAPLDPEPVPGIPFNQSAASLPDVTVVPGSTIEADPGDWSVRAPGGQVYNGSTPDHYTYEWQWCSEATCASPRTDFPTGVSGTNKKLFEISESTIFGKGLYLRAKVIAHSGKNASTPVYTNVVPMDGPYYYIPGNVECTGGKPAVNAVCSAKPQIFGSTNANLNYEWMTSEVTWDPKTASTTPDQLTYRKLEGVGTSSAKLNLIDGLMVAGHVLAVAVRTDDMVADNADPVMVYATQPYSDVISTAVPTPQTQPTLVPQAKQYPTVDDAFVHTYGTWKESGTFVKLKYYECAEAAPVDDNQRNGAWQCSGNTKLLTETELQPIGAANLATQAMSIPANNYYAVVVCAVLQDPNYEKCVNGPAQYVYSNVAPQAPSVAPALTAARTYAVSGDKFTLTTGQWAPNTTVSIKVIDCLGVWDTAKTGCAGGSTEVKVHEEGLSGHTNQAINFRAWDIDETSAYATRICAVQSNPDYETCIAGPLVTIWDKQAASNTSAPTLSNRYKATDWSKDNTGEVSFTWGKILAGEWSSGAKVGIRSYYCSDARPVNGNDWEGALTCVGDRTDNVTPTVTPGAMGPVANGYGSPTVTVGQTTTQTEYTVSGDMWTEADWGAFEQLGHLNRATTNPNGYPWLITEVCGVVSNPDYGQCVQGPGFTQFPQRHYSPVNAPQVTLKANSMSFDVKSWLQENNWYRLGRMVVRVDVYGCNVDINSLAMCRGWNETTHLKTDYFAYDEVADPQRTVYESPYVAAPGTPQFLEVSFSWDEDPSHWGDQWVNNSDVPAAPSPIDYPSMNGDAKVVAGDELKVRPGSWNSGNATKISQEVVACADVQPVATPLPDGRVPGELECVGSPTQLEKTSVGSWSADPWTYTVPSGHTGAWLVAKVCVSTVESPTEVCWFAGATKVVSDSDVGGKPEQMEAGKFAAGTEAVNYPGASLIVTGGKWTYAGSVDVRAKLYSCTGIELSPIYQEGDVAVDPVVCLGDKALLQTTAWTAADPMPNLKTTVTGGPGTFAVFEICAAPSTHHGDEACMPGPGMPIANPAPENLTIPTVTGSTPKFDLYTAGTAFGVNSGTWSAGTSTLLKVNEYACSEASLVDSAASRDTGVWVCDSDDKTLVNTTSQVAGDADGHHDIAVSVNNAAFEKKYLVTEVCAARSASPSFETCVPGPARFFGDETPDMVDAPVIVGNPDSLMDGQSFEVDFGSWTSGPQTQFTVDHYRCPVGSVVDANDSSAAAFGTWLGTQGCKATDARELVEDRVYLTGGRTQTLQVPTRSSDQTLDYKYFLVLTPSHTGVPSWAQTPQPVVLGMPALAYPVTPNDKITPVNVDADGSSHYGVAKGQPFVFAPPTNWWSGDAIEVGYNFYECAAGFNLDTDGWNQDTKCGQGSRLLSSVPFDRLQVGVPVATTVTADTGKQFVVELCARTAGLTAETCVGQQSNPVVDASTLMLNQTAPTITNVDGTPLGSYITTGDQVKINTGAWSKNWGVNAGMFLCQAVKPVSDADPTGPVYCVGDKKRVTSWGLDPNQSIVYTVSGTPLQNATTGVDSDLTGDARPANRYLTVGVCRDICVYGPARLVKDKAGSPSLVSRPKSVSPSTTREITAGTDWKVDMGKWMVNPTGSGTDGGSNSTAFTLETQVRKCNATRPTTLAAGSANGAMACPDGLYSGSWAASGTKTSSFNGYIPNGQTIFSTKGWSGWYVTRVCATPINPANGEGRTCTAGPAVYAK